MQGQEPQRRLRYTARRTAAFALAALAACESGTTVVDTGDDGDDTVTRADFAVRITSSGEDSAAAVALGWATGTPPQVQVTIRRTGEQTSQTGETDAQGIVRFTDLLPGTYSVAVVRLLNAEESARLAGGEFADVNAFGGALSAQVRAPADSVQVPMVAGRRGSLIISEKNSSFYRSETQLYNRAHFLELYNNGDTTVYLDGKVIADFERTIWNERTNRPCSVLEHLRLDPEGIWSKWHVQFPGSGRDYPLLPGETALLATDAVDHREFWPGTPDLRHADFESVGSGDVDNPAVPNVIDIGLTRWEQVTRNQGFFLTSDQLLVLAEPFDPSSLPETYIEDQGVTLRRIPKGKILDVVLTTSPPEDDNYPIGETIGQCFPLTHPVFDRGPARIERSYETPSTHRRTLAPLPDGRLLLQRTRTSATDLERRTRSPGRVP